VEELATWRPDNKHFGGRRHHPYSDVGMTASERLLGRVTAITENRGRIGFARPAAGCGYRLGTNQARLNSLAGRILRPFPWPGRSRLTPSSQPRGGTALCALGGRMHMIADMLFIVFDWTSLALALFLILWSR
jgi:hypothetical protein